jgi:hypothetical protein
LTQLELLRFALTALDRLNVRYAVVGSFASSVWGDPRMTRDIDIVVQLDSAQAEAILAAFPDDEFYISRAAVDEAIGRAGQFNVIHPTSGNKIDFMVAGSSAWSAAQLSRARLIRFLPDLEGYVAAPEDVILGKLIYYRDGGSDKHLRDITGIFQRSGEAIDAEYAQQMAECVGVADLWRQVTTEQK